MRKLAPERLSFLTKERHVMIADEMAAVTFREVVAVLLDNKMGEYDKRVEEWGLSRDELTHEPMPFKSEPAANRLLDILDDIYKNGDRRLNPAGAALWLSNCVYDPRITPQFEVKDRVGVDGLREGKLYMPHGCDEGTPTLPIVGTTNPTEGLCILRDNVSLADTNSILRAYGATCLAKVDADDSVPLLTAPTRFRY